MPARNKHAQIINALIESTQSNLEKSLILLNEIRSGKYYHASNARKTILSTYKTIVNTLSTDETAELSNLVIKSIPDLFAERKEKKVAYSTIANIIEYTSQNNLTAYNAYEIRILGLALGGQARYLPLLIGLANVKYNLTKDIETIENFIIRTHIHITKNYVNLQRLWQYTYNVIGADKKKMLLYLINAKPFINDNRIIDYYIRMHPELDRYSILV